MRRACLAALLLACGLLAGCANPPAPTAPPTGSLDAPPAGPGPITLPLVATLEGLRLHAHANETLDGAYRLDLTIILENAGEHAKRVSYPSCTLPGWGLEVLRDGELVDMRVHGVECFVSHGSVVLAPGERIHGNATWTGFGTTAGGMRSDPCTDDAYGVRLWVNDMDEGMDWPSTARILQSPSTPIAGPDAGADPTCRT